MSRNVFTSTITWGRVHLHVMLGSMKIQHDKEMPAATRKRGNIGLDTHKLWPWQPRVNNCEGATFLRTMPFIPDILVHGILGATTTCLPWGGGNGVLCSHLPRL